MVDSSVLKDIGQYKNKLISAFVSSDDICELLLNKKKYSEDDIENLIYTQIFPYLYIDDTQTDVKTYICCEVDAAKISTGTIKDMDVIIWVCSHKNGMKYSKKGFYGTKVDILADMIERQLRDSDKFGIGKLQLKYCTSFSPNNKYYGRQMLFSMPDFKVSR